MKNKIVYEKIGSNSKGELEQIISMEKSLYGEHMLATLDLFAQIPDDKLGNPGIIVVAKDTEKDQDSVVGYYIGLKGSHQSFCLVAVLVKPEYRNMGIGSELHLELLKYASEESKVAYQTIWPGNLPNLNINVNKLNCKVTGWSPLKYGNNPLEDNRFYLELSLPNHEINNYWKEDQFESSAYPLVTLPSLGKTPEDQTQAQQIFDLQESNQEFVVSLADTSQDYSSINWNKYWGVSISKITQGEPSKQSYLLFKPKLTEK